MVLYKESVIMKQQSRIKFKGTINTYVKWPLWLSVLLAFFNVAMFFVDFKAGLVMLLFLVTYISVALILYYKNKSLIINDLVNFATRYGQVQRQLLRAGLRADGAGPDCVHGPAGRESGDGL